MSEVSLKTRATALLHKYDDLRRELRDAERELSEVVSDYGRATGRWGLNKDIMRIELYNEERIRLEIEAERNDWEKANA